MLLPSLSRPRTIIGTSQVLTSEVYIQSQRCSHLEYHLLFDDLATSVFNSIDTLAERVRRIGGTTVRSVSQISTLQNISDDNRDSVSPSEMIRTLIDDNYGVLQRQREAYEICESNKDFPTANILEEIMDETERRIWFLKMTSEGGTHQN
jgi:starvation-inducible DNA-binding protein